MNDAQDVEKVREPQRPRYALDGVTQRQASHRELGGAEGRAWSRIRGPPEPSPLTAPGRPVLWAWRRGQHLLRPVSQSLGDPSGPGRQQRTVQMVNWAGGWGGHIQSYTVTIMWQAASSMCQAAGQAADRPRGARSHQGSACFRIPMRTNFEEGPCKSMPVPGWASPPPTLEQEVAGALPLSAPGL